MEIVAYQEKSVGVYGLVIRTMNPEVYRSVTVQAVSGFTDLLKQQKVPRIPIERQLHRILKSFNQSIN